MPAFNFNEDKNMIKYILLFLCNMIVATIIAIASVGFVMADGVDDPNFYLDFDHCFETSMQNNSSHCRKYDNLGTPTWVHEKSKIIYIPNNDLYDFESKRVVDVPEPESLLMIAFGLAGILWKLS
jgi:hypothetical protein